MENVTRTPTSLKESTSTYSHSSSMFFNVGGALIFIIGLILIVAWLARRSGVVPAASRHQRKLKVVDSCSLGTRERVVVVEVDNQWLVLGVTAGQINHLHTQERPSGEDEAAPQPAIKENFSQLLRSFVARRPLE